LSTSPNAFTLNLQSDSLFLVDMLYLPRLYIITLGTYTNPSVYARQHQISPFDEQTLGTLLLTGYVVVLFFILVLKVIV
jgi:hypothetical protein